MAKSRIKLNMTADIFNQAWSELPPGGRIRYHTGNLITDRMSNRSLNELASRVFEVCAPKSVTVEAKNNPLVEEFGQGQGILLQRRIGDHLYEYYAYKPTARMVNTYFTY